MHFFAAKFVPRGFRIYHEIVECPAAGSVAAQVAETMDGLVANSTRVGAAMERLLPAVPVRTLPFLTASAPMPAPQPRPAVGRRTLRIAFLGRLAPHKRPHRLIEALPAWDRTAPVGPARLDLYGGDYDGQGARLRELIDQFGLGDRVALRGGYTTADLPRIFAQSDLVVLPSTYEGLPLVLVEAMQHGVPIVATSAGGTAELGEGNPDAVVTPGTGWEEFEEGVVTMARRLRAGKIDAVRLHGWTEARYGFAAVSTAWLEALLAPQRCFAAAEPEEVLP
ncbi:MAG: glycosyltransferase family 4 protein [Verrucomicrobiota bacterium]